MAEIQKLRVEGNAKFEKQRVESNAKFAEHNAKFEQQMAELQKLRAEGNARFAEQNAKFAEQNAKLERMMQQILVQENRNKIMADYIGASDLRQERFENEIKALKEK